MKAFVKQMKQDVINISMFLIVILLLAWMGSGLQMLMGMVGINL